MSEFDSSWDEALALLSEVMKSQGLRPRHLVVCGGAALRAGGFVSRVTRDVDVLAERGEVDGEIFSAWPLSDDLKRVIADVAVEFKLPADWLNASTSLLIESLEDLPSDLWNELETVAYGTQLRISYIGRLGLIHLKIQAAIKRQESRDLDDLHMLDPNKEECLSAIQWIEKNEKLDKVERDRVKDLMKNLSHD